MALVAGAVSWASAASAAQTSFALVYHPAPACPGRSEFTSELLARSPWLEESGAAPELGLEVWYEQSGGAYQGLLALRDARGQVTLRRVPGATCAEVASALALVTAVLVDARREELAAREAAERPAQAPNEERVRLQLGVAAALNTAVAPGAVPGATLELGFELWRASASRPLVSLAVERTLVVDESTASGTASFRWTAGRLALCPVRLPAAASLAFRPCVFAEYGVIDAQGTGTELADSASVPWWAVGALGRLDWLVLDPLSVLVDVGFRAPIRRDRFYFDPDTPDDTAYEVPAAGFLAHLGLQTSW